MKKASRKDLSTTFTHINKSNIVYKSTPKTEIIYYAMSFSLHQGEVIMSSQIMHARSYNIHPLVHILGTCPLISVVTPFFTVYPNRIMERHPTPLQVISHESTQGRTKRQDTSKNIVARKTIIYICTRVLHFFLSFAYYRAAFTVISQLPKASFTISIQPNIGQPCTRPSLISAINTLDNINIIIMTYF